MPDFPVVRNIDPIIISPAAPQSLGAVLNAFGMSSSAAAWITANKAFYIPVSVQASVTIVKLFVVNGATLSGNIDVGIYDAGGVRLISSGSVAQAGTSIAQEFDITDTVLNPGLYYLACAMDNTTGTLEAWSVTATLGRSLGVCEQASAFALPATATFALVSSTARFPYIGATQRTVV